MKSIVHLIQQLYAKLAQTIKLCSNFIQLLLCM